MPSSLHALAIVFLLTASQGYAFFEQWRLGFRPFQTAPTRVPLSWDMFSIEIERCGVTWDPPIHWRGRPVTQMRELGAPIEWDPIFNHRTDYATAGGVACENAGTYQVRCFMSHTQESQDVYACPRR